MLAVHNGFINYKRIKKPLEFENLVVEIGFGNGEFLVSLAKKFPQKTFLGIELSGISIEKLMKSIRKESLRNVYCVRLDAYWAFYLLLKDESVETIYMNYPDPWFKKRHEKRRLTRRENLVLFGKKLKSKGRILIRTDDEPFFQYTVANAKETGIFSVKTKTVRPDVPRSKYEAKWIKEGKTIYEVELEKVREVKEEPPRKLEEVEEVFPVTVDSIEGLNSILNREFKVDEELILRTFGAWQREEKWLVEVLVSESGYVQKFFVFLRKNSKGKYVLDVSGFSEVLKTRGIQRVLEFLGERVSRCS